MAYPVQHARLCMPAACSPELCVSQDDSSQPLGWWSGSSEGTAAGGLIYQKQPSWESGRSAGFSKVTTWEGQQTEMEKFGNSAKQEVFTPGFTI